MTCLKNKTAIITGASSGIGNATARLFARQGANIVATARSDDKLKALVSDIESEGGRAIYVAGDITDPDLHTEVAQQAKKAFGHINIAMNNAGDLGEMGSCESISYEGWKRTLDVNLTGAFLGAQTQIKAMSEGEGGAITFTSTFVGHTLGFPGMAAYGAAKVGVIGLMRCIAVEQAENNIRSNAMLVGGVDTPMGQQGAGSPEGLEFVKQLHAMRRVAQPEEIAQTALYLASDMSSFVTGACVAVDGGVTITRT